MSGEEAEQERERIRKAREQEKRISDDPLVQKIGELSKDFNSGRRYHFFAQLFVLVDNNRQEWEGNKLVIKAVKGVRRRENYGIGRKYFEEGLPKTTLKFNELWQYFFDKTADLCEYCAENPEDLIQMTLSSRPREGPSEPIIDR